MANETYKQFQLMDRFSDITLSNTILVIIGAFIGVIGNTVVIFFYFFRIKERGERYFIPLLGIVDLLGCLISPPYYIMDNMYLLSYPSTAACRILSFVQIFIPGISGHTLLVISIQRYLLVCRPFGPKMTHFWKRVSFGVVCLMSIAYSTPLLFTAGVFEEEITFMNHNVTIEVCRFAVEPSLSMNMYVCLLFLLMVVNLIVTVGLYVPVLKRVKFSLHVREVKCKVHRDSNVASETENEATGTSEIQTDQDEKGQYRYSNELQNIKVSVLIGKSGSEDKSKDVVETTDNQRSSLNIPVENLKYNEENNVANHLKTTKKKTVKSKSRSAQRRITTMIFVLILAYVLSYTAPLIILILLFTLKGFTYHTMTRAEMGVWVYLTRLVFLNHIVNPFVYGYFDTKFRKQIRLCCRRKNEHV